MFTLALTGVGLAAGNNLVVAVAAACLAAWGLEIVLGGLQLRGLEVRRALPAEVYAGHEERGALRVINRRPWLASRALAVREEGGVATAGTLARIDPGATALLPMGWRFEARGEARLTGIRLASAWPFGLLRRERRLVLPAAVVVYPRPRRSVGVPRPGQRGAELRSPARRGRDGDFVGLRAWRPGDGARAIHWATTARRGELLVVERSGIEGSAVQISVPPCADRAWEEALGTACGQVLRAFDHGFAVGLDLPGDAPLPPRPGSRWRRTLLEALARAPRGGPQ